MTGDKTKDKTRWQMKGEVKVKVTTHTTVGGQRIVLEF